MFQMERIPQELINQSEEFDWEGISFPTKVNEIDKFEKKNEASVNVYYWGRNSTFENYYK